MNKLTILILSLISSFILISSILNNSFASIFFLPIPCYFVATLIAGKNDFALVDSKKIGLFYLGLVTILVLLSITKII
jgi:hypothetical protein